MIAGALTVAAVLFVNSGYACAALNAAVHCGIDLSLKRGAGLWVFAAGTLCECAVLFVYADPATRAMFVIGLGAAVTAAACDAACGYVFDAVTYPCIALLALVAAFTHALGAFGLGAAAAGGALMLLYVLTAGRGIGLGDVKLACCIGGAVGTVAGVEALGVAFVLGGIYAGFLLATKSASKTDEMRFAPYLASGLLIVALHGAVS